MEDRSERERRDALDLASEILRLRERGHNHENRIAALELRGEYQTSLMRSVEVKLETLGKQLAEMARRDDIEHAMRRAAEARDQTWLRGLALPQKALLWMAATLGAGVVIANAIRGLFG